MSLTRQTQKVFGSNANANQLAAFGSMKTGTPVYSTSLATLQSTAYTQGWSEALLNDKAPYMEEMNAVQYGLSYQIAYMLQEGAFAYDANTTYSNTSIVKAFENGKMYFYHSLVDNNIGHALSNTDYWEKINISDVRNIGEIVTSTIPLTDAGLHLLDGSLLTNGSYGAFVSYIADLYIANPTANYFTTEADWQSSVSTYGVCGKFVYDSVNNTVRLPKYSNKIYTKDIISTAQVKGNGKGLTLTNGTNTFTFASRYNERGDNGSLYGVSGANADLRTGNQGSFYSGVIGVGTNGATSGLLADLSSITTSLECYYYIVIATSTKTDIQVDIDEIATDLNGKADTDLTNVNDSGTSLGASWAYPSDTYINLTLGASGATYTAPANGWVQITQAFSTTNASLSIATVGANQDNICMDSFQNSTNTPLNAYLPLSKGQTFKVNWTGTLKTDNQWDRFQFIYAKGSESEASST